MMYTDRLVEIRKTVTAKEKEIKELNIEKDELWKKLLREMNDNVARYRKMDGLSGFKTAVMGFTDTNEEVIIIEFDRNSSPCASDLANIELDTGLRFKGNVKSSDKYGFGL